jgi:hypothetical protein
VSSSVGESSATVGVVSRAWNGSKPEELGREGMAEAASTVGFAFMSSGIVGGTNTDVGDAPAIDR